MKKSILTKIILAMLMLALIFAMVACNNKPDNDDDDNTDTPPAEATLTEQLMEILQGVNPLLATVNGIKADKTVYADLGLGVDFIHKAKDSNSKDVSGKYALSLKGQLNSTAPEFALVFKADDKEWFNLTYKDKAAYLAQPLTAVNNASNTDKMDKVKVDVSALEPAVKDLMYIVMDSVEKFIVDLKLPNAIPNIFEDEEMQTIVGGVEPTLKEIGFSVAALPNNKGNRLELTGEMITQILPLVNTFVTLPSIVNDVLKAIQEEMGSLPTIQLDILQTGTGEDRTISGLRIGYSFDNNHKGELNLDLGLSTSDSSVGKVSAPSYPAKALEAVIDGTLPQKGVDAQLKVALNPAFNTNTKYMGYASLLLNNDKVEGYFDGTSVVFDTVQAYEALKNGGASISAPANTVYSATLAKSLITMVNEGAANVKKDYINPPPPPAPDPDVVTAPVDGNKKGLLVNIYELIGGKASDLGFVQKDGKDKIDKDADGKEYKTYNNPTEQKMMQQLNKVIGDYVRFEIDIAPATKDKDKQDVYSNYINTVKNILKIFAANDEEITGIDMVDETKITVDAGWTDLLKAINTANFAKKADGKYGIANWDSVKYTGGIQLYDKDNTDLLDVVNMFACMGKDNDKKPIDITVDDICYASNYYVAALGYLIDRATGTDTFYTAQQKEAVDQADATYYEAKEAYDQAVKVAWKAGKAEASQEAKDALKAAKKAHREALDQIYTAAKAQEVIKKVLGVDANLKKLIEDGANLYIGSVKDGATNAITGHSMDGIGLNGYIGLKKAADSAKADTYIQLGLGLGFVNNDVEANATKVKTAIGETKALELTDHNDLKNGDEFVYVKDNDGNYLDKDGKVTTDPEKYVKVQEYPNVEAIMTELGNLLYAYCQQAKLTSSAN